MLVRIKVIPNAKKNEVFVENNKIKIKIAAPATEGKANKVLLDVLAGYFKVKKSCVRIVEGEASREKVAEVDLKECEV